jgi:hypothetical protein
MKTNEEKDAFDHQESRRKSTVRVKETTAEEFLKNDKLGANGEWGADQVFASNIQGGVSKLGYNNMGFPVRQVGEIRNRL